MSGVDSQQAAQSFVYFIRAVSGHGPVKIGSSVNPPSRLAALDVASPYKLEIALMIPGDMRLEWRIHGHFVEDHLQREWFKDTPRLNEFMWRLAEGVPADALIAPNTPIRRVSPIGTKTQASRDCLSYRLRLNRALERAANETAYFTMPDDVENILRRWLGHKPFKDEKRTPTVAELERLDAVISSPARHAKCHRRAQP